MTLINRAFPTGTLHILTDTGIDELRQDAAASAQAEANELRQKLAEADRRYTNHMNDLLTVLALPFDGDWIAEIRKLNELPDKLADMTAARDSLKTSLDTLTAAHQATVDENVKLRAEIAALRTPPAPDDTTPIVTIPDPVVVPPVTPPVVVTPKPYTLTNAIMEGVAMVTITKDDTPSTKQDAMVRDVLTLVKGMGFNFWRGLINFEESGTTSLPAIGREYNLEFIADTMDSQFRRADMSNDKLEVYLTRLKKHGARALWFDDVDADKSRPFIQGWLSRLRNAMQRVDFDVPVCGSFTANFNRADYPGFHFYEIQCFAQNASELNRFLSHPGADIFCLDGTVDLSANEMRANAGQVLKVHRRNLTVYTAKDYGDANGKNATDWRNMPDQVAAIRDMLSKWQAQRV